LKEATTVKSFVGESRRAVKSVGLRDPSLRSG
jgi:hypothetical protein